jgi:hypothetical protein
MKNFFVGLLIAAIIIGTGFGIKWEVEEFNKKYNPPIKEQIDEVEQTKEEEQTTEEEQNVEDTNVEEIEQ